MTDPAVSVIIPARDAAPTLERTLDALSSQTLDGDYEVVVVDDGSRDRTPEIVRGYGSVARLVANPQSRGPGGARNRGVQEARAPVLAFTDADCFPTAGWLAAGLAKLGEADLVQGRVEPDPTVERTPFDRSLAVDRDGGFYQTANLFVRRELFDAVGGFHDWVLEAHPDRRWTPDRRRGRATRTPIGEDTLFAWKALRRGARSAFAPDALVHHAVVPGGLRDGIADRWHWSRDMAGLAALVPELRHTTFHRRFFFNQVSASFDLALAGLLATTVSGRGTWMMASRPYIRHLLGDSHRWAPGPRAAYILGAPVMDLATLAGLVTGSVRWRSLIL
jgi:glycosyltransferase involved in cell wall biosynthesis